jgi:hypothetical protein
MLNSCPLCQAHKNFSENDPDTNFVTVDYSCGSKVIINSRKLGRMLVEGDQCKRQSMRHSREKSASVDAGRSSTIER